MNSLHFLFIFLIKPLNPSAIRLAMLLIHLTMTSWVIKFDRIHRQMLSEWLSSVREGGWSVHQGIIYLLYCSHRRKGAFYGWCRVLRWQSCRVIIESTLLSFFILLDWHLLFFEVTTLRLVLVKHWNSMIFWLKAIILVIQLFINTSKTWCFSLNIKSLVLGHKRCNKVSIIIHCPSNIILFTFFHPQNFVGLFHFF